MNPDGNTMRALAKWQDLSNYFKDHRGEGVSYHTIQSLLVSVGNSPPFPGIGTKTAHLFHDDVPQSPESANPAEIRSNISRHLVGLPEKLSIDLRCCQFVNVNFPVGFNGESANGVCCPASTYTNDSAQ